MVPRGIRNRNPCNITKSNSRWIGKVTPSQDPVFETFKTPRDGIVAACKLIRTYYTKYNLRTVRGIITRWSATDQVAYVRNVSNALGVGPDDIIELNKQTMNAMVISMIWQENGEQPYLPTTIVSAVKQVLG